MKQFLILFIAFVGPLAIYLADIDPGLRAREQRLNAAIMALDTRIEQARSAQRKAPQFHEESRRLRDESEKLRRIFPTQPDFDGMRGVVLENCALTGMQLTTFEPYVPRLVPPNDPYKEVFVDAEVIGPADRTAAFFRMLASDEHHIIDVSHVTMHRTRDGWQTSFLITSYVMNGL